MSKLPIISNRNQERIETPSAKTEIENEKTSELPAIINSKSPLVYETKLTKLESKILLLEQSNDFLQNKINQSEQKFQSKLLEVLTKVNIANTSANADEKTNAQGNDNNLEITELKSKINYLEQIIQKDNQWKLDQRQKDLDLYKKIVNKFAERIGETVKMEVNERFKGDVNNQLLTKNIMTRYETQIELLRKDVDEVSAELIKQMHSNNQECSERTQSVSNYIDQKLSQKNNENYQLIVSLQNFVHKLTNQVKSNLLIQNQKNDLYSSKLEKIEKFLPELNKNFTNLVQTIEARLVLKMREIKQFCEMNIKKSNGELHSRINELAQNVDANINLISQYLADTRAALSNKFNEIETSNKNTLRAIVTDLEALSNRIYQDENLIQTLSADQEKHFEITNAKVGEFSTRFEVFLVNERMVRNIENTILLEKIESYGGNFNEAKNYLVSNINENNKTSDLQYRRLVDRLNMIEVELDKVAKNATFMFKEVNKTIDAMQVTQVMSEVVAKVEDTSVIKEIDQLKAADHSNEEQIDRIKGQLGEIFRTLNESKAESNQAIEENNNKVNENIAQKFSAINQSIEELRQQYNKLKEPGPNEQIQDVNRVMNEILNSVEFANVYDEIKKLKEMPPKEVAPRQPSPKPVSTLSSKDIEKVQKQIKENEQTTKKALAEYSQIIENKIAEGLEKFKKENVDMWVNSVLMAQKYTDSNEIRKIIQQVPPVVLPTSATLQRIMDLGFEHENPEPTSPEIEEAKEKAKEERYGKK